MHLSLRSWRERVPNRFRTQILLPGKSHAGREKNGEESSLGNWKNNYSSNSSIPLISSSIQESKGIEELGN